MKNNDFTESVKRDFQGNVGPQNFVEVLSRLPSNPIANMLFRNTGNLSFEDESVSAGFDLEGFSHGMASADLDGDGRTDVVLNNMNAPASLYQNNTPSSGNYIDVRVEGPKSNLQGLGISMIAHHGSLKTTGTIQSTRSYMSSSEPVLHFGLGEASKLDSLLIVWNHTEASMILDIQANQTIAIEYSKTHKRKFELYLNNTSSSKFNSGISFKHSEMIFDDYADQILLPYKLSQNGPFISSGDFNGDGRYDLIIGGAAQQGSGYFIQSENGTFRRTQQPAFTSDANFEDMQSHILDINSDGFSDLYVTSGSNEFNAHDPLLADRVYLNDGKGTFTSTPGALPADLRVNGECVISLDIENDGDMDLFVGGRLIGGKYLQPADSKLLINENGTFSDQTNQLAPFLKSFGMVTDASVADIDNDGDTDILVVGEWMAPSILLNDGGAFSLEPLDDDLVGLWWTIETSDVNNDGLPDFILGNLGWNNKFGSRKANLKAYAGDIDNNGDYDIFLAKGKDDLLLPVRGRECSSEEMPYILEKFPTYDAFAQAHLSDILDGVAIEELTQASIGTFSSITFVNQGNGKFTAHELPVSCQTGPIKALATGDFNEDGYSDFIYAGNHYPTEVETARYDGLRSGIAYGDGKGNFRTSHLSLNGKPVVGDFRDIELISTSQGTLVIMSRNDDDVITFRLEDIL